MFLPIGDENPRETTPYVNYSLIGINIVAFIMFCLTESQLEDSMWSGAMIPAWVVHDFGSYWYTLFTSMFMHAGIFHIVGNMLFLWIFGDNIEDKMGHVWYAVFYFASGLAADGLHILGAIGSYQTGVMDPMYFIDAGTALPAAYIPTLGASGAISGVIGAYVLFFPRHRIRCFIWFYFFITVVHIQAFWWVGIWLVWSNIIPMLLGGEGVAYLAHIGGFIGGAALGALAKYVIWPARFGGGYQPEGKHVPSEFRVASRPSNRTYFQDEPLIEFEPEESADAAGIKFEDEPGQRYAVLRDSDELSHIGRIATITAVVTGEDTNMVIRRLTTSRGVIAKGVDSAQADRIRHDLHNSGIQTLVVPIRQGYTLPTPAIVESFSWNDMAMKYTVGADSRTIPWGTPMLYIAARVAGESVVDIFLSTKKRIRIRRSIPLKRVDMRARKEVEGNLHEFGQAVIRMRRTGAINEGVRVLAHRGSWGWLAFKTAEDYEDHVFWAYNMIMSSLPIIR